MTPARVVGGTLCVVAFYGALLLGPAETLHWRRAWVLLAVTGLSTLGTFVVLRRHEGLINERWRGPLQKKGQPRADKIVVTCLVLTYCSQVVFIPLDVFRFHLLLGAPPLPLALVGLVLYVVGWAIMAEAMRENAFASSAVRYQEERGHMVVDTGLYGLVRHPMYLGGIPLMLGMPLWLGSYAATLAGLVPIVLGLVARIPIEENLLRRELPGYEEYTRRVRWRLIPFVW